MGEIWTLAMGVLVRAGSPSTSLSFGSRALLRRVLGWLWLCPSSSLYLEGWWCAHGRLVWVTLVVCPVGMTEVRREAHAAVCA